MNRKVPLRIRKLMKELKAALVRIYGDKLKGVYLYGSYARGDYRAGSDVDVNDFAKGLQRLLEGMAAFQRVRE
ncbi:nucleotidyltransferase domain-containing protein [Candidatus Villigracilis affinis]|uniref:nucleotidyltransferase domain-containing protein n=1 Tax=Candidatus Villigracilis affinis TaxID=3140682 RepID=UPI001D406669|nr:nucleotidyltransferase domain-containing protein [Anaerolineales bacterium]